MTSVKKHILRWLGLRKMESRHKLLDPFKAQRDLVTTAKPVIFDVGASVGQTAAAYRRWFPNAGITCFEPNHSSFQKLQERFRTDANVTPKQLCLAEAEGVRAFHFNYAPDTSSLLPAASSSNQWCSADGIKPVKTVSVTATTLDIFCKEEKIPAIDILKMDAQGSELLILQGAHRLLCERKIGLIYTEVLFVPLYDGQAYFHDVSKHLAGYGYRMLDLFGGRYAEDGTLKWADAIFLRS